MYLDNLASHSSLEITLDLLKSTQALHAEHICASEEICSCIMRPSGCCATTLSAKKRRTGAHASASLAQSLHLPSSVIFSSVNKFLIVFFDVQPWPGNFHEESHMLCRSSHVIGGRKSFADHFQDCFRKKNSLR